MGGAAPDPERARRRVLVVTDRGLVGAGVAASLERSGLADVRVVATAERFRPGAGGVAVLDVGLDASAVEPMLGAGALVVRLGSVDARSSGGVVDYDVTRGLAPLADLIRDPNGSVRRRWTAPTIGPRPLTGREVTVIGLVAEGRSAADIGELLGISARTVARHKERAFAKLGATSSADAVGRAVRDGLIGPGARRGVLADAVFHTRGTVIAGPDAVAAAAVAALVETLAREPHPELPVIAVLPTPTTFDVLRGLGRPIVAVLPCEPDGPHLLALVLDGVVGYAPIDAEPARLKATVDAAQAGAVGWSVLETRSLIAALTARRHELAPPALSARERDVLSALVAGRSVRQTAAELGVSPRTVENTQRFLFRKLSVANRAQAIARALELGLLNPG